MEKRALTTQFNVDETTGTVFKGKAIEAIMLDERQKDLSGTFCACGGGGGCGGGGRPPQALLK